MHRKSRCEMLFGGNDISNDVITLGTCLSMFVYIRARFRFSLIGRNLTAESKASHREIGGGIQIPERDVVASSPSFSRPAARAPREACSQASAEFIDPSTVFFKVTNEDNFTKICRHRRKERLNIGKRVKFESDASKASMIPPPPPPEYKRLSIFGETWQCHHFIRLSFKLCRRIFTNCWKKKAVERSIWKIVVLMVRV